MPISAHVLDVTATDTSLNVIVSYRDNATARELSRQTLSFPSGVGTSEVTARIQSVGAPLVNLESSVVAVNALKAAPIAIVLAPVVIP